MSRIDKLLEGLRADGFGLEFGPSHSPVAPKRRGFKVDVIDCLDRVSLIERYRGHGVDLDLIEEVDYVWKGGRYFDVVGKRGFYDWIIASHFIEHTPDLIGFLRDAEALLRSDGVLSLAIPDKRFCFDRFRPVTGLAKVIDAYWSKNLVHTPGTVAEYYLNVVSRGGQIAWSEGGGGDYEFVHTLEDAVQSMEIAGRNKGYLDVHSWCFTPSSFRLLIDDLRSLGLIKFSECRMYHTTGCEFFVQLDFSDSGPKFSRMELLQEIDRELREC